MIKFESAEDNQENQIFNRLVGTLANGRQFEIGVHPVIFGYRIIGGYVGSNSIELNWCCGDNKVVVYATLKIMQNILEKGVTVEELPFASDIKPWPKDDAFIEKLAKFTNNPIFKDLVAVMDGTKPQL